MTSGGEKALRSGLTLRRRNRFFQGIISHTCQPILGSTICVYRRLVWRRLRWQRNTELRGSAIIIIGLRASSCWKDHSKEVLRSGEPDFPFCLCWANETWTGVWHGSPGRILIEQTYPGIDDHREHFSCLLKAFTDSRYIKVDGKPLFLIYKPWQIPELERVLDFWRELAISTGLKGLHIVSVDAPRNQHDKELFDGFVQPSLGDWGYTASSTLTKLPKALVQKYKDIYRSVRRLPRIIEYEKVCVSLLVNDASDYAVYQCLLPNWDNTPRSGRRGVVLHRSTPELFQKASCGCTQVIKSAHR